jgi:hypothetical protein
MKIVAPAGDVAIVSDPTVGRVASGSVAVVTSVITDVTWVTFGPEPPSTISPPIYSSAETAITDNKAMQSRQTRRRLLVFILSCTIHSIFNFSLPSADNSRLSRSAGEWRQYRKKSGKGFPEEE